MNNTSYFLEIKMLYKCINLVTKEYDFQCFILMKQLYSPVINNRWWSSILADADHFVVTQIIP